MEAQQDYFPGGQEADDGTTNTSSTGLPTGLLLEELFSVLPQHELSSELETTHQNDMMEEPNAPLLQVEGDCGMLECLHCRGEHNIEDCIKFADLAAAKEVVSVPINPRPPAKPQSEQLRWMLSTIAVLKQRDNPKSSEIRRFLRLMNRKRTRPKPKSSQAKNQESIMYNGMHWIYNEYGKKLLSADQEDLRDLFKKKTNNKEMIAKLLKVVDFKVLVQLHFEEAWKLSKSKKKTPAMLERMLQIINSPNPDPTKQWFVVRKKRNSQVQN